MAKEIFMGTTKSLSRRIAGSKSREYGQLFEKRLESACHRMGVAFVRIPDGCIMVRGRGGMVIPKRVKTPFDFVISMQGRSAFIDCKTIESGNFTHSMITSHQVNSLMTMENAQNLAGYVVWYRDVDKIIFYQASVLKALKPKQSLDLNDGIFLGRAQTFAPNRLFLFVPEL
jgi:hypothetical protein